MDQLESRLFDSPNLFPQKIDLRTGSALFIEVDRAFYRKASFLDDRILSPDRPGFWTALDALEKIDMAAAPPPARYIFHHGHCGSTLLTRLLDATSRTLALREPLILRNLADLLLNIDAQGPTWSLEIFRRRLDLFVKLFARTYPQDSATVVKTSSFCNDLGRMILELEPNTLAVGIYVPLRTYIATMLGGANTPGELRVLAPSRLRRLNSKLGATSWQLNALKAGECAAMSWTTEMLALNDLAELSGRRWKWIEFDTLLSSPLRLVGELFSHFEIESDSKEIASIVAGPALRTYSKAQEYDFDRLTRRELLAEYRQMHADEISSGARWFERAAVAHPRLESLRDRI